MPEAAALRVRGGLPDTEGPDGEIHVDLLREVTPAGETVWEWYAHDHMDLESLPLTPMSPRDEYAHANTCFPTDDGVLVSFRRLNAIFLIDRADGHVRWHHQDMGWGGQHDCQVLANGNIMLFANGYNTTDLSYSRIVEFDPASGETVWEYKGNPLLTFYSPHISGCQRLASGNTLICEGGFGRIFEVTPDGDIVWEYVSPFDIEIERGTVNWVFRAYRYAEDGPEIEGRAKA
jgi:outer membrane protein assembly factor BamB